MHLDFFAELLHKIWRIARQTLESGCMMRLSNVLPLYPEGGKIEVR